MQATRPLLVPLIVVGCLSVAYFAMGPLALAAFAMGVALTYVFGVAGLRRRWLARRNAARGPGVGVLAGALALLLLTGVLVLILLRASPLRPHSHPVPRLRLHPTLGHYVIASPEDKAAFAARGEDIRLVPPEWGREDEPVPEGLRLTLAVGQRLDVVDPKREHLIVIGDSVMFGWGVEKEETHVGLLQAQLRDVQALNASVTGWGLPTYYLALRDILEKISAEVVIVGIFSGNDLQAVAYDNWYGNPQPLFVPDGDGLKLWREVVPPWNCLDMVGDSVLYAPVWTSLDDDYWHSLTRARDILDIICHAHSLDEADRELVARRLFRAMADLAARHGAKMVFLPLPQREDLFPKPPPDDDDAFYPQEIFSWYPTLDRLLREEQAAGGGFDILWLKDALVAYLHRDGGEPADLYISPEDPGHFSKLGHRVVAAAIRTFLVERFGIR